MEKEGGIQNPKPERVLRAHQSLATARLLHHHPRGDCDGGVGGEIGCDSRTIYVREVDGVVGGAHLEAELARRELAAPHIERVNHALFVVAERCAGHERGVEVRRPFAFDFLPADENAAPSGVVEGADVLPPRLDKLCVRGRKVEVQPCTHGGIIANDIGDWHRSSAQRSKLRRGTFDEIFVRDGKLDGVRERVRRHKSFVQDEVRREIGELGSVRVLREAVTGAGDVRPNLDRPTARARRDLDGEAVLILVEHSVRVAPERVVQPLRGGEVGAVYRHGRTACERARRRLEPDDANWLPRGCRNADRSSALERRSGLLSAVETHVGEAAVGEAFPCSFRHIVRAQRDAVDRNLVNETGKEAPGGSRGASIHAHAHGRRRSDALRRREVDPRPFVDVEVPFAGGGGHAHEDVVPLSRGGRGRVHNVHDFVVVVRKAAVAPHEKSEIGTASSFDRENGGEPGGILGQDPRADRVRCGAGDRAREPALDREIRRHAVAVERRARNLEREHVHRRTGGHGKAGKGSLFKGWRRARQGLSRAVVARDGPLYKVAVVAAHARGAKRGSRLKSLAAVRHRSLADFPLAALVRRACDRKRPGRLHLHRVVRLWRAPRAPEPA
mmetsp:Transcript_23840/g.77538  ORF Transcript_23840/g.77538 Transcript_23840/m.77538 type:complete len:614 (-) Transcript_23840:747-2588(-)